MYACRPLTAISRILYTYIHTCLFSSHHDQQNWACFVSLEQKMLVLSYWPEMLDRSTVDLHKTENQSSERRMEAGGEGGAQDATRFPRHMGGCPTSPPPPKKNPIEKGMDIAYPA